MNTSSNNSFHKRANIRVYNSANDETAKKLMEGFRMYYNFLRSHMGLEGNTPAEEADIDLELGRNRLKNLIKQSVNNRVKMAA